ncbi:hypothetical protein [Wenzhouxiangella sp. XN24]|uniref:glucosamine inositolphosphorylceramide transferase family protein n=1 Tax=Wenzhouxiangella sp. XN24 TaxID=2713569 RepID=UPI0013EB7EFE|nr:hypothetical protein [Wenzhouxiangella sp. XN24]NGX16871.1 hypothetical protein [Wenzhouxiangella sp. XN24]
MAADWRKQRFDEVRWIDVAEDRLLADPCLVAKDGVTWLFMEELRFREGKGFISVMNAACPEEWANAEPVLVLPHHVSFPGVFEYRNEYFMLPEQSESGRLVLYHSRAFPHDWQPCATLLEDMVVADPVLLEEGGYWWLFFSFCNEDGADDNTQLYYAEHLDGPYKRFAGSPIHEGLKGSRMAGQVFRENGKLIRPAQDCRRHYGEAIIFQEITELTPESYSERTVARVGPRKDWPFNLGVHNYSRAGGIVAIDGFRYRR